MKKLRPRSPGTPAPAAPKTKKVKAREEAVFKVRLYRDGEVLKWDAKRGCRILSIENGAVRFTYKRPRSPKMEPSRVVSADRLLQFGGSEDSGYWVYELGRKLIDTFLAVSYSIRGDIWTFKLVDGSENRVNKSHFAEIDVRETEAAE